MAPAVARPSRAPSHRRSAASQRTLLAAAASVFAEYGYADASIAEVVRRAGASIGSLYHHFGGKAGLYLALYESYQSGQEARAEEAVAAARGAGEHSAVALFLVGAESFLTGCWREREVARVFLDGDAPPGFALSRRQRDAEWLRQNSTLLGAAGSAAGRALALTVTAMIGAAASEIVICDSTRQATRMRHEFLRLLDVLLSGCM